jgi:hypothetical protein
MSLIPLTPLGMQRAMEARDAPSRRPPGREPMLKCAGIRVRLLSPSGATIELVDESGEALFAYHFDGAVRGDVIELLMRLDVMVMMP